MDLGAKIVWFPTLSAKNHLDQMGGPAFGSSMKQKSKKKMAEKPITVLDDKEYLLSKEATLSDMREVVQPAPATWGTAKDMRRR